MGSGSRYVCLYLYLHSYFQFLLLLFNVCIREDHRHVGVWLSPGLFPAARLPKQHVKETGTKCSSSDPGLPQGLLKPVSVPVHLHLHTPAPAGPGGCAPAPSWSCRSRTQSCCEQMMGCVVMAASVMQPFWPTLHHDTVTGQQTLHYGDIKIRTFLLFIGFKGINVGVKINGVFVQVFSSFMLFIRFIWKIWMTFKRRKDNLIAQMWFQTIQLGK